jgi:hypothetical protein
MTRCCSQSGRSSGVLIGEALDQSEILMKQANVQWPRPGPARSSHMGQNATYALPLARPFWPGADSVRSMRRLVWSAKALTDCDGGAVGMMVVRGRIVPQVLLL